MIFPASTPPPLPPPQAASSENGPRAPAPASSLQMHLAKSSGEKEVAEVARLPLGSPEAEHMRKNGTMDRLIEHLATLDGLRGMLPPEDLEKQRRQKVDEALLPARAAVQKAGEAAEINQRHTEAAEAARSQQEGNAKRADALRLKLCQLHEALDTGALTAETAAAAAEALLDTAPVAVRFLVEAALDGLTLEALRLKASKRPPEAD